MIPLCLKHLKVKSLLNNAQRHSARIEKECRRSQTREGMCVNYTGVWLFYWRVIGPLLFLWKGITEGIAFRHFEMLDFSRQDSERY